MTLFITSKNRLYEIDDAYVMALCFIISYFIALYTRKIIDKVRFHQKQKKIILNTTETKTRGGQTIDFDSINWKEFDQIVQHCIEDDKAYLLLNNKIKKAIRFFLKLTVQKNMILTPNLIRLIAMYFTQKDKPSVINISNVLFRINNTRIALMRYTTAIVLGLTTGLLSGIYYGIVILIMTYICTPNVPNCEEYFKEISSDAIHKEIPIFGKNDEDHLIVSGRSERINIYIPKGKEVVVTDPKLETKEVRQTYKKVHKKAKEVKFSDFKKNDPILSKFDDLEEPKIRPNKSDLTITRKQIAEALDTAIE